MVKSASTKNFLIVASSVLAKVVNSPVEDEAIIAEILTYEVSGGLGGAAAYRKDTFYQFSDSTFPAGFTRLVVKKLEGMGHVVTLKRREAPAPLGPERPVVDRHQNDPRYEYQYQTADRLLQLRGMIAQIATGGGKSRIFKICAKRIGRPTLFVTTRKTLMYQMAETYEKDLGEKVGIMGDGKFQPINNGVNFAIVDTLASHLEGGVPKAEYEKLKSTFIEKRELLIQGILKRNNLPWDPNVVLTVGIGAELKSRINQIRTSIVDKYPIPESKLKAKSETIAKSKEERRAAMLKFLAQMEFVCLEEAHETSAQGYYDVMNACKNALYRLALTATPFMRGDEHANMRLMAVSGPIGIVVTEKQLIDSGILATPYFKIATYPKPVGVFKTTAWVRAYAKGVVECAERNAEIERECLRAKRYGLPVMILVQQTKHGKLLLAKLSALGLKVNFISGESKQTKRQEELTKLGKGQLDVLIGSTILDVGVDVPAVGVVILAGGGKAEVQFRQRVGRGMRSKKNGPNAVFILDFNDMYNRYLAEHAVHRQSYIRETPGFSDKIVADFDYDGLGFKKVA